MPSRWRELLRLAGALTWASTATAQEARELGVQVIGTASDPAAGVAGVYGGLRTSARTRVSLTAGAGVSAGDATLRGELLGHFLISPRQRQAVGFYVAGGLAAVDGPVSQGYLVLALGLEDRPGAGAGWAVELGVGGGVRVAAGYRWRWFRQSAGR